MHSFREPSEDLLHHINTNISTVIHATLTLGPSQRHQTRSLLAEANFEFSLFSYKGRSWLKRKQGMSEKGMTRDKQGKGLGHKRKTGAVKITHNNHVKSIHEVFLNIFFPSFYFYIQTNQNTNYGLCTFLFVFTYIFHEKPQYSLGGKGIGI